MILRSFDVFIWMCITLTISGTTTTTNSTTPAPITASPGISQASSTAKQMQNTTVGQPSTTPKIIPPTKPVAVQVPTKLDVPTKPSVVNNTIRASSNTVSNAQSTVQPLPANATNIGGNTGNTSQNNGNGTSSSTPQLNQIFETLVNGLNSLIQNATSSSNNGQNPLQGIQDLPQLVTLLSNFLPDESKNILTAMTQNQSAITPENVYKVAGPVFQLVGTQLLAQVGISKKCSEDLGTIVNGILARDQWALSMLDAMGKLPPNILASVIGGHPHLLGGYDECNAIKDTSSTIKGQYCTAYTTIPVPQMLTQTNGTAAIGLCVSKSCSEIDIKTMINRLEGLVLNETVPYEFEVICSKTKEWGTDMIVVTCFLSILAAIIFLSTLYDVCVASKRNNKTPYEKESHGHANVTISNGHIKLQEQKNGISNGGYVAEPEVEKNKMDAETNIDSTTGNGAVSVAMETKHNAASASNADNIAERICLSFSMYSNGVKLLSTNQGAGSLGVVNGVRFLSMGWVILGHTYYFAIGYDQNLTAYWAENMSQWSFMAVPYATVSVDSFFALSGVLVAYLTLKELKKVGGAAKMNWFMFYFHRFWRLTPPYMLIIMVGTVVLPYIVEGPLASNDDNSFMYGCRKNWWKNLLYINNYLYEDMCLGWSWYLSNDMQFYIISPLILLPFFYNAAAGIVVSGAFLLATITASGVVAKNHEYPIQLSPFVHPPKDDHSGENLYIPSYARMGPYVVGLATGYMLYRCKRIKCRIPKTVNLVCWLLCLGISCAIIYGPYTDADSHIMSLWGNVMYNALNRTGWGIVVCWVIFSCATGNGGLLNEILSWPAFIPLGRLTYCAYLVHPLVMVVYYSSQRTLTYFTHYELIYLFLAHMVMSYAVAFVTSLFFESPMMGLEKAVFQKKKK